MEAVARAKFVRHAPRKVNQVLGLIHNKPVEKALSILSFTPKTVAPFIAKTLQSAIANGGRLKSAGGLKVKECWVGQGPTLKRMRPGPMGRGLPYKRKTCHLTIVVADMTPEEIKGKRKKKAESHKQATVQA